MVNNARIRLATLLFFLVSLFVQGGCVVNPVTYNSALPEIHGVLYEFSSVDDQVAGIAVSREGRTFVGFPRWGKDPRYSLAELLPNGSLHPYPDAAWNQWGKGAEKSPGAHFISVQGVFASDKFLWVLDSPSPFFRGPFPGAAKLVCIDLKTDRVKKVIPFDRTVAPAGSFLMKVCVDQWEKMAYVSDAGTGALIVADLDSGHSRRVLAGDPSTRAEPGMVLKAGGEELRDETGKPAQLHVDGIALDADSTFLYYHALTARSLYRIQTRYLNDPMFSGTELAGHVERLADTGAVDGMAMDGDYNLYLAAPEENGIKRYRVYDGSLVTLVRNDTIAWPDSICTAPLGYLYFTATQFNRLPFFNRGKDRRTPPFRLFRILRELQPAS